MSEFIIEERSARQAWAKSAAKHHSWPDDSLPEQNDSGRFSCGWHESEFQIFYAGVKYALSKVKTS